MATLTLADVRAHLPDLEIGVDTMPTEDQVSAYIDEVEAEVRGFLLVAGAAWPDPSQTDAARTAFLYIKQTVLAGVKYQLLSAKYLLANSEPDALQHAYREYQDRLKRVGEMAAAVRATITDPSKRPVSHPVIAATPAMAAAESGSFFAWTRAIRDERRGLPYPHRELIYPGVT